MSSEKESLNAVIRARQAHLGESESSVLMGLRRALLPSADVIAAAAAERVGPLEVPVEVYLEGLLSDACDATWARSRMRFLEAASVSEASCSRITCAVLYGLFLELGVEVLLDAAPTRERAIAWISAWTRRGLLDATLALDLWGVEDEPPRASKMALQVDAMVESISRRQACYGLTEAGLSALRARADEVLACVAEETEAFLGEMRGSASYASDFAGTEIPTLHGLLQEHWRESIEGPFDRGYVARRRRLGRLHHGRGRTPQDFLVGMGDQLVRLLRACEELEDEALRALYQVALMDMSLVIDACLGTRAPGCFWQERPDAVSRSLSWRFDMMCANLSGLYWEADAETGALQFISSSAQTWLGFAPSRLLGKSVTEVMEGTRALLELEEGQRDGLEHRFLMARPPRWLKTNACVTVDGSGQRVLTGLSVDVTYAVTMRDSHELRWLDSRVVADVARIAVDAESPLSLVEALVQRVTALPGVEGVAVLSRLTLRDRRWRVLGCEGVERCVLEEADVLEALNTTGPMVRFAPGTACERLDATWVASAPVARGEETIGLLALIGRGEERRPGARELVETMASLLSQVMRSELATFERLEHQKLEAIGMMACGVAHDLRNIFASILLDADALRGGADISLDRLVEAAERGADFVSELMSMVRPEPTNSRRACANEVLEKVLWLVRSVVPPTVRLESAAPDGELWVAIAASRLHQILLNLIVNATQVAPRGTVRVTIAQEDVLTRRRITSKTLEPGSFVVLRVVDDGPGISSEVLPFILEPFRTGREEGTGLGLSIVNNFVSEAGGALDIQSQAGRGTHIAVYLPRAKAGRPISLFPAPLTKVKPSSVKRRVLVAEDDPELAQSVMAVLELHGFDCLLGEPRALLTALASRPESWDLLLTDYAMPEMSGTDLISQARLIKPSIPVILGSGYEPRELALESLEPLVFLRKPYRAQELIGRIEALLEASSGEHSGRDKLR